MTQRAKRGWYQWGGNPKSRFVWCEGLAWDDDGNARVLVFEITGHNPPRSERRLISPRRWRGGKPAPVAKAPRINHRGDSCEEAAFDCEQRGLDDHS